MYSQVRYVLHIFINYLQSVHTGKGTKDLRFRRILFHREKCTSTGKINARYFVVYPQRTLYILRVSVIPSYELEVLDENYSLV